MCCFFGECACVCVCVHELSFLFRWILSVCLVFFRGMSKQRKANLTHVLQQKKWSEIGWDSEEEEEEDAKQNVAYSMQINEQISLSWAKRKISEEFFSTRHENYAYVMCVSLEMGQSNPIILFTASLPAAVVIVSLFVCMQIKKNYCIVHNYWAFFGNLLGLKSNLMISFVESNMHLDNMQSGVERIQWT